MPRTNTALLPIRQFFPYKVETVKLDDGQIKRESDMALTLAFDIYGTLIDTAGVTKYLAELIGDDAHRFSECWRQKQLEYSFRRGLMSQYVDFSVCTRDALEFTCQTLNQPLAAEAKQNLLQTYRILPAFADVLPALERLKSDGHRLFAFSNGKPNDLTSLLEHAGLSPFFSDTISVHEIGTFKPNPKVYQHFLKRTDSTAATSWLISSNPFDVLGAMAVNMQAAWIKRSPKAHFDPWGVEPTLTVESLIELAQRVITNTE